MTDQKKSRILLLLAIALAMVSVVLTYKRAFVDRDFLIVGEEESALESEVGEQEPIQ